MKYKYLIALVVVVFAAGLLYAYWPSRNKQYNSVATTASLPNISAPTGWQAEPQSSDHIIFMRSGNNSAKIDVSGIKTNTSLEQWLGTLYNGNFPYDLTATSSVSGAETLPWALINKNLVLVDVDQEGGSATALNYSVYNDGNLYIFSLVPYQLNKPPFPIENPQDVESLKEMVQNFAESLPPNTL